MKNSIWKYLAEELNGKYIERKYDQSDKSDIRFREFQIVFDNYTFYKTVGTTTVERTCTRIVCPYTSLENFKFQIYRKGFLDSIRTLFGEQDIIIGSEQFDKDFVIKSNIDYKLKKLMENRDLIDLIQAQKRIHIEISDNKGIWGEKLSENNYELSYYSEGEVNSIVSLKSLYKIFTILIDQLSKVEAIKPINAYS